MSARIHGLRTVTLTMPHDKEAWVEARTSLSPHTALECIQEKQRQHMRAAGGIISEIGEPAFNAALAMLNRGVSVEEAAARLAAAGERTEAQEPTAPPAAEPDEGPEAITPEKEAELVAAAMRKQYDLDFAVFRMVKKWSLSKKVKLAYVRNLDGKTRRWLHELAWDRLRAITPQELAGNS